MSNYFAELRRKAKKIEDGISSLSETWRKPQFSILGCKEIDSESKIFIDDMQNDTKNLYNAVTASKNETSECIKEMTQFVEETQNFYESLKQDCNDIEHLFLENGYVPEQKNMNGILEENESEEQSSILKSSEMQHFSIDSTNDTVLSKTTFDTSLMPSNYDSAAMSTPVINRELHSVLYTSSTNNSTRKHTPSQKRTIEPLLLCPKYYNLMKK